MEKTASDSLIRAGFVMLAAYGIFNLANFLYHFISARMLGPAEYSIVASLFSIVYLVSIASTTIQNTATKFTADFKARKEHEKIAYLFRKGLKKIFVYSFAIFVLFILICPFIAQFLKVSLTPLLILSPIVLLSFLIPLNRGILQGQQRFNSLGINLVAEGALKLLLAVFLIYLGLKANGAIAAAVIGTAAAFALTFPLLKFKKTKKASIKFDSKEIYRFTLISFIALLLITMVYSMDVFLVKHFFSAEIAGNYAALSLLGKILFFGATAIGIVMFPKISGIKSKADKGVIFRKSLLFTSIISSLVTAVYFIFPAQIVNVVFGASYANIIPLLGMFGVSMTLLSLSYICVLNKLANEKKKFAWILLIAVVSEIMLISVFHSSLNQIVLILIILNALLFLFLLK